MTINTQAIIDALASYAMASGHFDRVNAHEPKNAPGNGLSCAIWMDGINPLPERSGLAATAARLVFNVRVYQNFISEPQDAIDPRLVAAVDALMTAYSGDYDLGGTVAEVDLLGNYGVALAGQAGYLNQDSRIYRVFTLTVPVVVNDTFTQAA